MSNPPPNSPSEAESPKDDVKPADIVSKKVNEILEKNRRRARALLLVGWVLAGIGFLVTAMGLWSLCHPSENGNYEVPISPRSSTWVITLPAENGEEGPRPEAKIQLPEYKATGIQDPASSTLGSRDYATVSTGLVALSLGFAFLASRANTDLLQLVSELYRRQFVDNQEEEKQPAPGDTPLSNQAVDERKAFKEAESDMARYDNPKDQEDQAIYEIE